MALYAYICTRTTAEFVVPVSAASQTEFNRKVSNAFRGLLGGVLRVGDIRFRPIQRRVDNHLLCDGSTIDRISFPQLVELLNPGEDSAVLPDFTGTVTVDAPPDEETHDDGGTTSGGGDDGSGGGGDTGGGGGNTVSGGRPRYEDDPPIGGTL